MTTKKAFLVAVLAASALAVVGCSDDDNNPGAGGAGGSAGAGGTAGMGGEGGMGGTPAMGASLTAAHFAPEVPSAENTEVAIFVDGVEVEGVTISYGESTGRLMLPAGEYTIGLGVPGTELLTLDPITLNDGDDFTAVAYRDSANAVPVGVFLFPNGTDDLTEGNGRVWVGHGADDAALDPVDVIITDEGACPDPLLDQFAFGTFAPAEGVLDLAEGIYNLGFDLDPGDCDAEVPFSAPVNPGVTSILVAVDEDTGEGLSPQVWAIVDASDSPIALIE